MSFNKTCKTGSDLAEILITNLSLLLLMVPFKLNLSGNTLTLEEGSLGIKKR
jgi:hypothetical protein